jgi:hypothetical protein
MLMKYSEKLSYGHLRLKHNKNIKFNNINL